MLYCILLALMCWLSVSGAKPLRIRSVVSPTSLRLSDSISSIKCRRKVGGNTEGQRSYAVETLSLSLIIRCLHREPVLRSVSLSLR